MKEHHKAGIAYGFSQFVQYIVFAGLFYASIKVMKANPDVGFGDVFIAIFAMMFGATAAGQAQQFGPDIGKAGAAAKRIFNMIETPSSIDA